MLLGYLQPGATVEVVLINTKTDEIIPSTDVACTESIHHPGLYRYDTTAIGEIVDDLEIAYVMKNMADSTDVYGGKATIGKWLPEYVAEMSTEFEQNTEDLRAIVEDVQLGNWSIENQQMVMKTQAGEELARFNLYDFNGNPTNTTVAKRIRVS